MFLNFSIYLSVWWFVCAFQGILLIWEQFEDTEHHSFHAQRSVPGLLLLLLRVVLALLLASILYQIISSERSALKRDFYLRFAKVTCSRDNTPIFSLVLGFVRNVLNNLIMLFIFMNFQGCFLWFLCHPVLVILSGIFNEHQREKVRRNETDSDLTTVVSQI